MTRKIRWRRRRWAVQRAIALTLAGVLVLMLAMVSTTPKPAAAIDPTLDAALVAIAQATARAQAQQAAQRATAVAVSSEATRQANIAQATVRAQIAEATAQAFAVQSTVTAISAEATRTALDELQRQRAMTATSQAQNLQATRTAQEATATAAVLSAQATGEAYRAMVTAQAVELSGRATDTAKLSQTYAERQARFSLALLIVELGFIAGALLIIGWLTRTLVLWAKRLAPQPVSDAPNLAEVLTDSGAVYGATEPTVIEQQAEPEPRMPDVVTVIDNPAMVEALDRWAERYDKEHGVTYGD